MASALAKTVNKGAGASVSNNISCFHKHIYETTTDFDLRITYINIIKLILSDFQEKDRRRHDPEICFFWRSERHFETDSRNQECHRHYGNKS